jgi:hypothetical protein
MNWTPDAPLFDKQFVGTRSCEYLQMNLWMQFLYFLYLVMVLTMKTSCWIVHLIASVKGLELEIETLEQV